jgi:4-hydroxybenzoate polyprenyltransferase
MLLVCLLLALAVVLTLPPASRGLCLTLAVATLPLVLLYPSAKRWFPFPQAVLALCWGFAVLIPWAAATGTLAGGWPLALCWLATVVWTFGFDTVYAMADRDDDRRLGVRSSALSLGPLAVPAVAFCYGLAWLALGLAAAVQPLQALFWPLWLLAGVGMARELRLLQRSERGLQAQQGSGVSFYGRQFAHQVQLGALLLLALIVGRG